MTAIATTAQLRHTNAIAIRLIDNAAKWAAMTPEQQRERIRRAALHCQFHAEAVRMVAEGKYGSQLLPAEAEELVPGTTE